MIDNEAFEQATDSGIVIAAIIAMIWAFFVFLVSMLFGLSFGSAIAFLLVVPAVSYLAAVAFCNWVA